MRKYIEFIFLFIFLVDSIYCQDFKTNNFKPSISYSTSNSSYEILEGLSKIQKILSNDFNLNDKDIIKLQLNLSKKDQKLVEGMESMSILKLNIEFKMINQMNDESWIWSHDFNGKGVSLSESINYAIDLFIKNKEGYTYFAEEFNRYLKRTFDDKCETLNQYIIEQNNMKEYYKSLSVLNHISKESPCYSQTKSNKEEIFNKLQEQECIAILKNAILSKSVKDYRRAIEYLIHISPSSPCQDQVFKLAKQMQTEIDDNFKNLNLKEFNNLNLIINSEQDLKSKNDWYKQAFEFY